MTGAEFSEMTRFSPELCAWLLRMDPSEFEGRRTTIKTWRQRLGAEVMDALQREGHDLRKFWNNHKSDPAKLKRWAEEGQRYRAAKQGQPPPGGKGQDQGQSQGWVGLAQQGVQEQQPPAAATVGVGGVGAVGAGDAGVGIGIGHGIGVGQQPPLVPADGQLPMEEDVPALDGQDGAGVLANGSLDGIGQQPPAVEGQLPVGDAVDNIGVGIGHMSVRFEDGGQNSNPIQPQQVSTMATGGAGGAAAGQDRVRHQLLALVGQGVFTEGGIGDKYEGISVAIEDSSTVKLTERPHMAGLSIGSGMFGNVSIVRAKATDEPVAVKTLKRKATKKNICAVAKEISNLRDLQHDHVVVFYDAYLNELKQVHIVMELCPKGCLKKYLDRLPGEGAMTRRQLQHLLAQIGSAVAHMHERGYVHRDIKPGNIFLRASLPSLLFVLGDFGTSRPSDVNVSDVTMVGSLAYMAPEMLQQKLVWPLLEADREIEHFNKNDVYALGVCAVEAGVPAALRGVNGMDHSFRLESFTDRHPAGTIVPSMMHENPHHRPNAAEIVQDPWVTGI